MRGAATTGDQWIFFAYKHGEQGNCYARTGIYQLEKDLSNLDLILGILIDWVRSATVSKKAMLTACNRSSTRRFSSPLSTSIFVNMRRDDNVWTSTWQ